MSKGTDGRFSLAVRDIEAMLEDRMERLARELLPAGIKRGREYVVGSLGGEQGDSLSICISGGKCGWWKDFASGESGDALGLVAAVLFRSDVRKAVAWAKSWLNLTHLDPPAVQRHRIEARAQQERKAAEAEAERARSAASARARWQQGVPWPGTPVETYLRSRAIDLRILPRAPGVVRFHPRLTYGFKGPELPAMVHAITLLSGEHVATHRTWLNAEGTGKAGADVLGYDQRGKPNKAKKVLGLFEGGHIPLWKGEHRQPLRDIPPGIDVYASEGPEDGWTAAVAQPRNRVICFVALSNLIHLQLPPQMGRLIILAQNDPPGSAAAQQLRRAITAHRAAGRTVLVAPPPPPFKDINEMAMAEVAAAARISGQERVAHG